MVCECARAGVGGIQLGWWLEALCRGRPPTAHKMPSLNGSGLGPESPEGKACRRVFEWVDEGTPVGGDCPHSVGLPGHSAPELAEALLPSLMLAHHGDSVSMRACVSP